MRAAAARHADSAVKPNATSIRTVPAAVERTPPDERETPKPRVLDVGTD
jgi:hypothetical protein